MKSVAVASIMMICIIIITALLFILRYDITVHSPIIVKFDRLTGKSWVANSGVWMEIRHEAKK